MSTNSRVKIRWVALGVGLVVLSLMLAACGGDDEPAAESTAAVAVPTADYDEAVVQQGQRNFGIFCTACHGPDAMGIRGLGPTLMASDFFNASSDDNLLEFIIEGRTVDHPDNTTGIAMPARGGYPNLSDEQITEIIAFLRTDIADG